MDQNIIILILILIAILVSFYSTYLSIDNSRKIKRLQMDIRETLGNINSTLHLNNNLPTKHEVEEVKVEDKTKLQELEQFPSLDEIENYDSQRMMKPLDANLKKELDDILEENNSEEDQKLSEQPNDENTPPNNSSETENLEVPDNMESELLEENLHEMETPLENNEVEKLDNNSEVREEVVDAVPEAVTDVTTEVKVNPENDDNIISLEDIRGLSDLDNQISNSLEVNNLKDNVGEEVELESVISNMEDIDKKNLGSDLPSLDELNQEVLQKMHDKNVKLICKREGLKVRGTKTERISRILEEILKYKININ